MKANTKLLATLLAGALTLGATSCTPIGSGTDWIYEYNGQRVPSGVYITYQYTSMSAAYDELALQFSSTVDVDADTGTTPTYTLPDNFKAFSNEMIGEQTVSSFVEEKAKMYTYTYFAVEEEALRLGVSLDPAVQESSYASLKEQWASVGADYEEIGISVDSWFKAQSNTELRNELFYALYDTDGERAVSQEELAAAVAADYLKMDLLSIPKEVVSGDTGTTSTSDASTAQSEASSEDTVSSEVETSSEEVSQQESSAVLESEAEVSGEATSSTQTEVSEETQSDSVAEGSEESSVETSEESSSSGEMLTVENPSVSATAKNDQLRALAEEYVQRLNNGEAIEDLYLEYQILTGDNHVHEDGTTHSDDEYTRPEDGALSVTVPLENQPADVQEIIDAVAAVGFDESVLYEDDNYLYVMVHRDISKDSATIANYSSSVLIELKEDDFNAYLTTVADGMNMGVNESALKRYSIKNLSPIYLYFKEFIEYQAMLQQYGSY